MRLRLGIIALGCLALASCRGRGGSPDYAKENIMLAQARADFKSEIKPNVRALDPIPDKVPPSIRYVRYKSPAGDLPAYLSVHPNDGKKRPAMIWITGGESCLIDDGLWQEAPPENDQTASAFRKAGIVTMFPSLRGTAYSQKSKEGFYGEVEDVLAAADFLAKQPNVDPTHIYLGGHSTGGTLVMLVSAYAKRFRAVFAFGPAAEISGYPPEYLPFNTRNPKEIELRSPVYWLHSIQNPTFVIEGTSGESNSADLQFMANQRGSMLLRYLPVEGADHFTVLGPATKLLAKNIKEDTSPFADSLLTTKELNRLFSR